MRLNKWKIGAVPLLTALTFYGVSTMVCGTWAGHAASESSLQAREIESNPTDAQPAPSPDKEDQVDQARLQGTWKLAGERSLGEDSR